ncbi:amino acid adenylation domain-containing protein [Actinoplanes sp. NPDC049548]|uniref:non-ribosomal peptide synthetase n=1 Tax=Actinoplanes sp. NPDC049548 TaxID=3155152 RepID=UPI0034161782
MSGMDLLTRLRDRGVHLRVEEGRLRYTGPAGALTEELRTEVALQRADLIELLTADDAWSAPPDPARRHETFPLTDLQQAYLVGEQDFYAHRAPALFYHEYHLDEVDADRLESALRRLSDAYDLLRLAVTADGEQRFRPGRDPGPLLLRARADDMAALRASVPDDLPPLSAGRPYLIRLVELPGGWRLQVALRLIAFDGVTTQLFFRELAAAYRNPGHELRSGDFTFADYVRAVHTSRRGTRYRESLHYWQDSLDRLPGSPALPVAPAAKPAEGEMLLRLTTRLAPEVWRRLRVRSAAAGLPVGSVLFALFAEALQRWSDADPAAVTVLAGHRPHGRQGIASVWGNCSTTVPVELPPAGGSFRVRAAAARTRLHADLQHSAVSGVEVTRLRRRRTASGGELPVVFTSGLDLVPGDPGFLLDLPGARLAHSSVSTPQVLLDHQVYAEGDELVCNFDHAPGNYPPGMIDDLAAYHRARLHRLAEDPQAWDDPEPPPLPRAQLTDRCRANDTTLALPAGALHGPALAMAVAHPERVAVRSAGRTLDFATLDRESAALAARLRTAGLRRGDLVAVLLPKGWTQVVAVLGITRAGGAYLPVDARWPDARVATVLTHSRTALAVTDGTRPVPGGVPVVTLAEPCDAAPEAPADPEVEPGQTAYVIYTSGSTGTPKGVRMAHEATANTLLDLAARFGLGPEDAVLAVSALGFDLSVFDVFGVLGAGGTVVLPPDSPVPDPAAWAACVRENGVTVWNSVPALLDLLLEYLGDRASIELAGLRLVMLSGDWFPLPLLQRLRTVLPNARVVSLGGATEAAIWSNWFDTADQPADWTSVPYGYPLANQSLHVLDRRLADAPTWVPGDLYLGGAGVALGYLNDPERTAEAFLRHPRTGERLYRTGDRARYRPGGIVEFLGRRDTQVKIGGFRIELGEIEAQLLACPGVEGAVAVVADGQRLAAFVSGPAAADPEQLRPRLAERLPSYMVPGFLGGADAFPLSGNGKVDRKALAARVDRDADRPARPGDRPLHTASERRLAAIWSDLLGVAVGTADADFFALGGDSLLAVRLFRAIEQAFGRQLPLSSLFRHGTVAAQAGLLAAAEGAADPVLAPLSHGTGPRIVLVHPVGGNVLCYQELVRVLRSELDGEPDVYGLRAVGLRPGERTAATFADLVEGYLAEITAALPDGPLHLAGWSMGGTICLALAERLRELGRPPASVVLVDSFTGGGGPGADAADRTAAFLADLCGGVLPGPGLPAGLGAAQRALHEGGLLPSMVDDASLERLYAVYENNARLLEAATPAPWPPRCVLVRAGTRRDAFPGLLPVDEVVPGTPAERIDLDGEDHYSVMRGAGARRVAVIVAEAVRKGER